MSNTKPTRGPVREKVKEGIWRRRLKDGRWRYEVTYTDSDGRDRRTKVENGGLREAEALRAEIKASLGRGERVAPNPRLTFAAAAEDWLAVKSPNLADKTIATYRYGLDVHLLPAFGRMKLSDLSVSTVAKFVAQMGTVGYRQNTERRTGRTPTARDGYSAATIKSVLVPLSRTFAHASRHLGFVGANPVLALDLDERPGYKQRPARKPALGRQELDALIASAVLPWRDIIATAFALGTRLGETLGIAWRNIDFGSGVITIDQQANARGKIASVKTAAGVRKIEAPDWLVTMFREARLRSMFCDEIDLVFCTRTGQPHRHGNVRRGMYAALDAAGLPQTSFHSLRHSHASLWIKDGGDVITLSKRLGHATPQVTMSVYARDIEEASDHAARRARANALFDGTAIPQRLGQSLGLAAVS